MLSFSKCTSILIVKDERNIIFSLPTQNPFADYRVKSVCLSVVGLGEGIKRWNGCYGNWMTRNAKQMLSTQRNFIENVVSRAWV